MKTDEAANQTSAGTHAVVIGGSMAGLLAARVLADHFDRVTIVDRDRFPDEPAPRKGVPQAQHIHVLLTRGQRVFEQLFPGLADELSASGAQTVEWAYDSRLYTLGVWLPRVRTGFITRMCSRDLLEFTVRRRVANLPNVCILKEREALRLLASGSGSSVSGVRTQARASATASAGDDVINADLIVDASGRSSHTLEWLKELGYGLPAETIVNSFLGYASRLYAPPSDFKEDWKSLIVRGRAPLAQRGGVIYAIEGNQWLVTLAGAGRDYPPLDDAGFLDFTHTLGDPPVIYNTLRAAKPLEPIVGYQRTDNRWRHYERLERWPDNFIVLGDAACAFNPVYGQGMTVAGMEALALDQCLRQWRARGDHLNGMAHHFQQEVARILKGPWLIATSEDYRVPQTVGAKPGRMTRATHAYMDWVTLCAAHDEHVYRVYIEVLHLLKPPTALFSPASAARVLLRRR